MMKILKKIDDVIVAGEINNSPDNFHCLLEFYGSCGRASFYDYERPVAVKNLKALHQVVGKMLEEIKYEV